VRRIAFVPLFFAAALSAQTYGRLDFHLQTAQGQAVSGATVHVYQQPSAITTINVSTVQVLAVTTSSFPSQTIYYTLVTFTSTVPPISSGQTYAFSGLTGYTALNGKTLSSLASSTIFTMTPIYPAANQALFEFGSATYASTSDTGSGQVVNTSACGSPANISTAGQAALYSTATGGPLAQPVVTTGFGEAFAYAVQGCYTVVYSSPYTGTLTYKDQNAIPAAAIVSAGGSSGAAKGVQQAIQFNNSGVLAGSAATVDSAGDLFTPTMLNVGTSAGNSVSITPLGSPTNWTLDTTSPATAYSSIVPGNATFPDALTINASLMSGADPCEQISNAFGVIRSMRSGIVDACGLAIHGTITCSSDPFASIQTAYTDFGGKLRTCQANIIPVTTLPGGASGNTLLPWKIPNAIEFDGGSSHPLASPTYPAPRGTTFQPAPSTPPYKGPIIALGGYNVVVNNFNPMGVKLKNFAVSCLAPGTTYATTSVNITSWSITGSSYPYTGVFTYSGAANQVAQWDVLSLANFGTTTAFNGPFGKHMVVTAVTANTFTVNINVLPSSATEAGNAIVSMGTTGIINEDAQEGSGVDTFSVAGCTTAYAVDVDPNNGIGPVASSGFDSQGAHGGMITMPADPSAVCFKIGGTPEGQLLSFPANIENISGNSCQGTLSGGVSTGTFAAIEAQNVYFGLNRMAYLDGLVHAGFIKSTNTLTFVNTVDSFSNVSYPWTNLFYFGPKVGHTITIIGGGGLGTAAANAVTLFDFNYPTGPCTLLASNEGSIGFYTRGIGGGGNGSVVSTARTGCVGTPPAGMASTLTGNTFGFITNFASSAHMAPTGTATGGGNFGSNTFAIDGSYWNGSAAVTVSATVGCGLAAGATPNLTCNLAPPATAPNLRVLTLATGGAVPWDIIDFGASATTTTNRIRGNIQMFNLAGTFHADFPQPTLTGTRTYTLQDASGTLPLTIVSGTATLGTGAITAGTCATAVTVTATNA
jgi:hypothetical protein